jgi:ribonuclease Z
MGFIYVPPFRVQGISIAGEESVVQVPELNLCFDIGRCPKIALASDFVGLSHGHMDHSAGLAYYFSHRHFQGMTPGTVVCHPAIEKPIHNVMRAWVDLEAQLTPYKVVALPPESEIEIKHNVFLRAFSTVHTVPSLGFLALERRSKLRSEYIGLSQEKLVQLKNQGEDITRVQEVPLVCYTGDTAWGPHFERADVLNAKILIVECTFLESDHRNRASMGKHLHLSDILELVKTSKAEAIVLTHMSLRTRVGEATSMIYESVPPEHHHRLLVLMDSRGNRRRYEQQLQATDGVQGDQRTDRART